mmetsp:Transcript_4786/g.10546  ORF Transcript_4786/g.10546 Transcript_4786/m.10546 type:complete len:163 (-) Transcript_4786:35-523(-)
MFRQWFWTWLVRYGTVWYVLSRYVPNSIQFDSTAFQYYGSSQPMEFSARREHARVQERAQFGIPEPGTAGMADTPLHSNPVGAVGGGLAGQPMGWMLVGCLPAVADRRNTLHSNTSNPCTYLRYTPNEKSVGIGGTFPPGLPYRIESNGIESNGQDGRTRRE